MNKKYITIVFTLLGGVVATSLFTTVSNVSIQATLSDISKLSEKKEEIILETNSFTSVTTVSKEVEKLGFLAPNTKFVLLDKFALK